MSRFEFIATGDLGPCRKDPASIFENVRDRLRSAELVLGQLEPVLTDRGSPAPQARLAMRAPPSTANALRDAGLHVISFASNHCMDWGNEGLLDTCDALRAADLAVVGAGEHLAAARAPVIVTFGDTRVAILACNSILPQGYWAESNRPGCAPMRAWTIQEQIEQDQPGTPSRVHTFAHRDDLRALIESIENAKGQADIVILSMHWGIHFVPEVIADYQREVAHAAIDAGADIVIGHHPHLLKGIEMYRSKAIFYSLGNFAIDPPTAFDANLVARRSHREIADLNPNWRERGGHLTLADSALAIAVRCDIDAKQIQRVSALPVFIDDDSRPAFVRPSDAHFSRIASALEACTRNQALNGAFTIANEEFVVI